MNDQRKRASDAEEGPMELGHEAVPGYKGAFIVIFALACLYLGWIFISGGPADAH